MNQFKIRLGKFAQRGEPPQATFRKIQNSKINKKLHPLMGGVLSVVSSQW